ncbi:MAG: pyridoxal-phosphate dependent enzyme, partial [Chloroflexia bacterium]|nr:pyridoxal-phosphate dependent enzyme [Chloroflexia bacterium]
MKTRILRAVLLIGLLIGGLVSSVATVQAVDGGSCHFYFISPGVVHVSYEYDLSGRSASLWRYREVLPCGNDDGCGPVSLGEGMTPLVRAAWDGAEILWKLDFLCPTGSYKDRGASVLMSRLRDLGVRDIIEDSSGNAGAAMAAYSARAGIRCRIFVPDYTSEGKCVQIGSYGAELVR